MKLSIKIIFLPLLFSFGIGQNIKPLYFNKFLAISTEKILGTASGELIIKDFRGDISIQGQASDQVVVMRKTYLTANSKEKAEYLLKKVNVNINKEENEVGTSTIIVNGFLGIKQHLKDSLLISVPKLSSVAVQSCCGNINLIAVQGEINVSIDCGDIHLEDLSGKVIAHTSSGDVKGNHISGSVSVSGGNIEFQNVKGELIGEASNGNIVGANIQGSLTVKTLAGNIDLYQVTGQDIYGATSSGNVIARHIEAKSNIDFHSDNGDLDLDYLTGNLEASTSNGHIELDDVRGVATVWTSIGEIYAKMIRSTFNGRTSVGNIFINKVWDREYEDHEINLKTSAGDIELLLPNDFPANFRLNVLYPSSLPSEAIISDFPLYITAGQGFSKAKGRNQTGIYSVTLESAVGTIKVMSKQK